LVTIERKHSESIVSNKSRKPQATPKPPLRWTGIVFAAALNLLLVSAAQLFLNLTGAGLNFEIVATMFAPLIAGAASGLYIRERAGAHVVLGGLLSIPFLGWLTFAGIWQFALLAGAFCGMAGAITEVLMRSSAKRS
jgi:hypothetical protein